MWIVCNVKSHVSTSCEIYTIQSISGSRCVQFSLLFSKFLTFCYLFSIFCRKILVVLDKITFVHYLHNLVFIQPRWTFLGILIKISALILIRHLKIQYFMYGQLCFLVCFLSYDPTYISTHITCIKLHPPPSLLPPIKVQRVFLSIFFHKFFSGRKVSNC